MDFICKVGTPAGSVELRRVSAASEAELRADLERGGFYVFSVRRALGWGGWGGGRRRVRSRVLILFGQELATLLKAGLPLFQALDIMTERQTDPAFKQALTAIRDRVKSGTALSDAVKAEGAIFPPVFSASLVAGERSGNLEIVLRRFVQYVRLNENLKWKAISAAVYPVLLIVVMVTLVSVLMLFVIPRFEEFYSGMGGQLPLMTRVLVAVARWAKSNVLWVLLGLVASGGVAWRWRSRAGAGAAADRLLLGLPHIGRLFRIYATSQLCRTLSTLLAGGLPLINGLAVAAASMGNRAMARAVEQASPQIREGKSLTVALESTGMLENLALEMIKVGEQTGALGEMLGSIAEFYDQELESRMTTLMALIEPLMIVGMAIVVALMLLAFYLPLFQSFSALSRGAAH